MKCHDPATDHSASVQVFANGLACTEFALPSATSDNDANTLECFIPVSLGDKITISGEFRGTVLHGAIDLFVDGTYVADKRIEGLITGDTKFIRRKVDFEKVFDNPVPQGHRSIYPSKVVVEGEMRTKALQIPPVDMTGDRHSLGSIVIRMSFNQNSKDSYQPESTTTICGAWKDEVIDEMRDGGIAPTYGLAVEVTDNNVHQNRQSKHRRHATQIRFGSKPWATLVFFYRSRAAIQAAGCVPMSEGSIKLKSAKKPVDKPNDESSGEQPLQKLLEVRSWNQETKDRGNSIFVSPPPLPAPKQKLFGQPLFKPATVHTPEKLVSDQDSDGTVSVDKRNKDLPSRPISTATNDVVGSQRQHGSTMRNDGQENVSSRHDGRIASMSQEMDGASTISPVAPTAKMRSQPNVTSPQMQTVSNGMVGGTTAALQAADAGIRHRPMAAIHEDLTHDDNGHEVTVIDDSMDDAPDSFHVQITSNMSSDQGNGQRITNVAAQTAISQDHTATSPPNPATPSSHVQKRKLSPPSGPTENTPSKRPRGSDKARMLAELAAKKQLIEQKKAAVAEQKRLREEAEEKLREEEERKRDEEECAELQREIAEADEVAEGLEKELRMEQDRREELMMKDKDGDYSVD